MGLTFNVLGDPGGHLWDHPGTPEWALGTTPENLRNQTPKTP